MKYNFDTSALINPWRNHYPPDRFPSLWNHIDKMIQSGEIVATEMVYHELKQKDDALLKFVKERDKMFIEVDERQQEHVRTIVNYFPQWIDPNSTKDQADPFVVALAIQQDLIVVTDEQMPPPGKVKIPKVCNTFGVECLSVLDFLRHEDIVF